MSLNYSSTHTHMWSRLWKSRENCAHRSLLNSILSENLLTSSWIILLIDWIYRELIEWLKRIERKEYLWSELVLHNILKRFFFLSASNTKHTLLCIFILFFFPRSSFIMESVRLTMKGKSEMQEFSSLSMLLWQLHNKNRISLLFRHIAQWGEMRKKRHQIKTSIYRYGPPALH